MSDDPTSAAPIEDPAEELAMIVDETRRHLIWLQDAGITRVRREIELPAAAPSAPSRPGPARPAPREADHARPSFLGGQPRPPPAPSAPPPAARQERPVAPKQAPPARPPEAPAAGPRSDDGDPAARLRTIRNHLGDCRRCGLCHGRTNIVYGQGNAGAEIVFLGEGPGEDEDISGLAFVGRAGQLLTRMIEAMGTSREDVYICNIVKCRPPRNRRPEPDEVENCRPFAEEQIRAIRPKVIVALGATAAQSLLRVNTPITRLRNRWHDWEGIPVMPTFHPSYLLRAPQEKAKAWDDLKAVLARLGREPPRRK